MQSQRQCLAAFQELDQRASDGINVRLLWRACDDRLLVAVTDAKSGDAFTIDVGRAARPLDVFHHPYAYAGRRPGNQRGRPSDVIPANRDVREAKWDVR